MSKKTSQKRIIIDEYNKILDFMSTISPSIINYMEKNPDYEYKLYTKYITHSDVISKGKRNEKSGYDKNYLYYLTVNEMLEREKLESKGKNINDVLGNDYLSYIKTTSTAHQSCIAVSDEVYKFLDIPNIHKDKKNNEDNIELQEDINSYCNVYLVNDTLKYFDIDYTKKIIEKLGKECSWNYDDYKLNLSEAEFTEIHLTEAAHGFGTAKDEEFQKLRMSVFLNDKLIVLMSKHNEEKNMFIIFDKNPRFYTILGECNSSWEKYLVNKYNKDIFNVMKNMDINMTEEKTRKEQSKWRKLLAEEMMNFSTDGNRVFCPLTGITVDFEKAGVLFRASHIKAYKDCDSIEEAYDINNGILMVANADALFDKHYITISDDGDIIFSYLIDQDLKLKSDLLLTHKVFNYILTPKRKEYLEEHRKIFYQKEEERKVGNIQIDEEFLDEEV